MSADAVVMVAVAAAVKSGEVRWAAGSPCSGLRSRLSLQPGLGRANYDWFRCFSTLWGRENQNEECVKSRGNDSTLVSEGR